MEDRIVLAGACRTAIGSMLGALANVPAVELGAVVIKEALRRAKVEPKEVDHVYMGNVIQAGLGQNTARQAAIKAGIPIEIPAVTVNVVCGSGLNCVNMAAQMIRAGEAEIVVAGGMENMSLAPYILDKARVGYHLGNAVMKDSMVNDGLWDAFNDYHMGITAENIAEKWNISREEMDLFALESHRKAVLARESCIFEEEIVPVEVVNKKIISFFAEDEGPRSDSSIEKLSKLRPAFKAGGKVTAANSSSINDGAAAIIVMSEKKAKKLGVKPMAYWAGGTITGVSPDIMGIGPVAASRKLMDKLNLSIEELDIIEANEAFAAQAIAVKKELNIPDEKLNPNGGAIALGHPVGASGTRILVTLLYEMKRKHANLGMAALCIGGGMGCAVIVQTSEN